MRYAIVSDIHANLQALETVLADIDRRGVDQIVCLGDVVGYNANPNECSEILQERNIPTVLGNHDSVACGIDDPAGFNPVALEAAIWTRKQITKNVKEWLLNLPDALNFGDFVAVHGAPRNRNTYMFSWEDILPHLSFLEEQNSPICMFGHTHSPGIYSSDGAYSLDENNTFQITDNKGYFINTGSVGQPRDGDPRAGYGLLDTDGWVYEQVRIAYPINEAAKLILEAGLPSFLAKRLGHGR